MIIRQQLVELLLGGDSRAAAAACLLSEAQRWPEILTLAQNWKVTPQLSARLQALGINLSAEDRGTLRREFLRVYGESSRRGAKTILAIHALDKAGISVAAFKGVACMALLYGGPKYRTIWDGDLLVSREDLPDALACLEKHGLARKGRESLDQYIHFVENAPRFAGNEAIAICGEDGLEIDLHWSVSGTGLRVGEMLVRSAKANLMDSSIPVVDAKDGFLLTLHHAIREDLWIESVCRDLLDVRLWCSHLEETGQLEAAVKQAAESGAGVAALAITSLLRDYDKAGAAARAASLLSDNANPSQRRSASLLTKLFRYQIRNGRLSRDVFLLVHLRPWAQIVRGLTADWSGYWRSMTAMETQLNEKQSLLKRFVQLARSAPGPQGLRLARELARAKYRPK